MGKKLSKRQRRAKCTKSAVNNYLRYKFRILLGPNAPAYLVNNAAIAEAKQIHK